MAAPIQPIKSKHSSRFITSPVRTRHTCEQIQCQRSVSWGEEPKNVHEGEFAGSAMRVAAAFVSDSRYLAPQTQKTPPSAVAATTTQNATFQENVPATRP